MGLHSRENKSVWKKAARTNLRTYSWRHSRRKTHFQNDLQASHLPPRELMAYIQAKIYKRTMDLQSWEVKH